MSIPLSYGRETKRFTWRRIRRYVFGAAVLGIAIASFVYRDPLTAPFRWVYWQARLDQPADNQKAISTETKLEPQDLQPQFLTRWSNNDLPTSWFAFSRSAELSPYFPVYMGLHNLSGKHRLVVVWRPVSWTANGAFNMPTDKVTIPLVAEVFEPATLFSQPQSLAISPTTAVYLPVDQLVTLYVSSHRPGTNDRFEMPYRSGDQSGVIVGQLHADDTVTFEVESGPATLTPNVPIAPVK